jgi:hypothetical protein
MRATELRTGHVQKRDSSAAITALAAASLSRCVRNSATCHCSRSSTAAACASAACWRAFARQRSPPFRRVLHFWGLVLPKDCTIARPESRRASGQPALNLLIRRELNGRCGIRGVNDWLALRSFYVADSANLNTTLGDKLCEKFGV